MRKQNFHSNVPIIMGNQLYLERPHLFQLLEQAVQSPLVVVVAGSGYGKTHAVYSFLHQYHAITTWIQLSERDNLGSRFWENFVKAVSFVNQDTAGKLAAAGFPVTKQQFDRYVSIPYTDLFPELKYIFVYDDFHLLQNEAVLQFMERSLTSPFQNITSIIISRNEPDINMVPLISKGLLAKITEEDLRFSQEEMLDYFRLQDLRLTPEAASSIYHECEGWAFAVHLTSLSLKKGRVSMEYARSSMKINIFKLIEHEIFSVVSPDLQKYLIKLSLIEHWNQQLLIELADPPGLIEELKQIGSFIRYDIYLTAYRIHPLFLEYLHNKQYLLTEEEKQGVYTKAAGWCMENDFKMDAVSYYEKAGNYPMIFTVMYTLPQITSRDTAQFLLDFLDRAPSKLYEDHEIAYGMYVRILLVLGRFEEARLKLKAIIQQFESLPFSAFNNRVLFNSYNNLGLYGILTCSYTQNYDFYRYFERAGFYYLAGDQRLVNLTANLGVGSYICRVGAPEKGHMEQFIDAIARSIPYISFMIKGCMYGYDDLARAELAYFREDLGNAEKHALSAIYKAREKKQYEIETVSLSYLLRINLAQGNYEQIRDILKELNAQMRLKEYPKRHILYDMVTGWFFAQIGQSAQIPDWLKNDLDYRDQNSLFHGREIIIKVKYQLLEKRYPAALAVLENERNQEGIHTFLLGKIAIRLYEAICLYQFKAQEEALKVLETAYRLSESNGLDMPFIEMGKDMRALVSAALKAEHSPIPKEWLKKIQRKSAVYSKNVFTVTEQYLRQSLQPSLRITPLSRREMELLTGLSHGLTREELADAYALSINTVKSVIKSIYTKLNAVNRADAIRIATALGILKEMRPEKKDPHFRRL